MYHKEEYGDHKTYFDEFRDKDFKKKWKGFHDKYGYEKGKKYKGKDGKVSAPQDYPPLFKSKFNSFFLNLGIPCQESARRRV